MRTIYITFFLLLLSACSKSGLPAGDRGNAFLLADKEQQSYVISQMKKNSLPFEVDSKGKVNYLLKDHAEVLGIIRSAQYGSSLSPTVFESKILVDDQMRMEYEEALDAANIPYKISSHNNLIHMHWSQIYGPQVDEIRQKIEEARMAELKLSL